MRFAGSLLVFASLLAIGCGGGDTGPQRYRLSGSVTFDGKPVPAGSIYFQPDSGPPGSAQIKQGRYDTSSGTGIVGGPYKIMIEGFDGAGTTSSPMGKPIFKPHTVSEDLPKANGTKDFEVPASAAKGLVISDDPA